MKNFLLRIVAIAFCFLGFSFFQKAASQVQTPRYVSMTPNSKGYYEYLPQGYSTGSQTYPLIIFAHGLGELGDGSVLNLPKVLRNGIPKLISQGIFPTSFTVNGLTQRFIILSPQFVAWPQPIDINSIIDYAIQHYRVNVSKIYLTGLSMGGAITYEYPGNNSTYANRLAAILPICGASYPDHTRSRIIAGANIAVWATQNDGDASLPVSYTIDYNTYINEAPAPVPPAKYTIFHATGHDAWTKTYDPNFTENGLNVYQWMLQYTRGSVPVVNKPPVANAGTDVTITLPVNSAQLNGSASSDPDGTISSYSWTKVAGPTQFTINSSSIVNPSITNLVAGTYTFRLTVKDNAGASATDDVNIIVNSAPLTGSQRVLIDLGTTTTSSPDQWSKYWNNMTNAQPGVRISNAKTTTNTATTIGLEVINRIDGTFSLTGTGLNTGNTTGVVSDYPATATTDYAFAHYTATAGKWRIFGLNALTQYTIKFWGTKVTTVNYTIQIKRSDETVWQEYNAANNINYNTAAVFTFTGKTEMSFDIRTKSGSSFGYINLVDISTGAGQKAGINTQTSTVATEAATDSASIKISPNPVQDQFVLQVNNTQTGAMTVQIIDQNGAIRKEFQSTKNQTGSTQLYLPANDLPAGVYVIRVQIGNWSNSIKMVKL